MKLKLVNNETNIKRLEDSGFYNIPGVMHYFFSQVLSGKVCLVTVNKETGVVRYCDDLQTFQTNLQMDDVEEVIKNKLLTLLDIGVLCTYK